MKRATDEKLIALSDRLRLTYTRDNLVSLVTAATEARMTPRDVLEYVLGKEVQQREQNRIKIATMAAHFPRICSLEDFDYTAQPSLDAGIIRELAKLEWLETGENAMFLGPPGVGKTHLAIALGREAVRQGKSVLFISAANLMETLVKAHKEGHLQERLTILSKPKLLIVDEVGYLPFTDNTAHLFFQLICRRYEQKSILLTSNRPIGEWGLVFGDTTIATAILDRLMHHCTPITINGESYRLRSCRKAKLLPSKS